VDFTTAQQPAVWEAHLAGVDAVINTVGLFRERGRQTFDVVHDRAPRALFAAALQAGVPRVIQISALGADEHARSRYHVSKRRADDYLRSLPLEWTIVQPSLIYGPGGTSARFFTALASGPVIALPGRGDPLVQPVHIDDVIEALVRLLENTDSARRTHRATLPFVGPRPLTLREFLSTLRAGMGLGRPRFVHVPMALARAGARGGDLLPGSLLSTESLEMLMRGNVGDPAPMQELLGRSALPAERFVPADHARAIQADAKLQWLLPLLRWSIAIVWIVTGIVSFGIYPVEESYALLRQAGVPQPLAPLMLYGAAGLDLVFGIAMLVLRNRQLLYLAQIAVIVLYTAISIRLPEFWLHPYGPILKNLPMLAAIVLLYSLERR
jgi:uncharacterized protein YbjT (DUF2867 family)/uncharacterized membrane protein YphA (DoxX/SURF4 family)